jgi:hypothetical protein
METPVWYDGMTASDSIRFFFRQKDARGTTPHADAVHDYNAGYTTSSMIA